MSPTEEFKALLLLMNEIDHHSLSQPVVKLLKGWEKRTSDSDKKQIFAGIHKREWRMHCTDFKYWVFEQKTLYPQAIDLDVHEIGNGWDWADSDDVAGALERMGRVVEQCHSNEYLLNLVQSLEGDFLNRISKNTALLPKFQDFLLILQKKSSKLYGECIADLPQPLFKKIVLAEGKKHHEAQRLLLKILDQSLTVGVFEQKILPALAAVNPQTISSQLDKKLAYLVGSMSFDQFSNIKRNLIQKGWEDQHIDVWARPLNQKTFSRQLDGWMTHWAQHHRSALLGYLSPTAVNCVEHYLTPNFGDALQGAARYLDAAQTAGITLKEINSYLIKHPKDYQECLMDFFQRYSSQSETAWQKNFATKNFKSLIQQAQKVLPPVIFGTMVSFLYSNGYSTERPVQILPFKPLTFEQWKNRSHWEKRAKQSFDTQQQYMALQQNLTIQKSLPTTKNATAKRKI